MELNEENSDPNSRYPGAAWLEQSSSSPSKSITPSLRASISRSRGQMEFTSK